MTEQELIKAIESYIQEKGIGALDILISRAWENGYLTNVTLKIEEHGTNKFGHNYD